MRIAIFGATSQIAKDLVLALNQRSNHDLILFARRPAVVFQWLTSKGLQQRYRAIDFSSFEEIANIDAILNFVGVGDPAQATAMGASIFDVTIKFDEIALAYVRKNPNCKYIFLSSGAAYGSNFEEPADEKTNAVIAINKLQPHDWYAVAKLHAECRHRSLSHLPIIDIRIFNYFSSTMNMETRFLIADIIRSIKENKVLKTSSDYIVRDFIGPTDFCNLIESVLQHKSENTSIDCFSKSPIDKPTLLSSMQKLFNLRYEITDDPTGIIGTSYKKNYYSTNRRANIFGYQPELESLDVITQESKKYFEIYD